MRNRLLLPLLLGLCALAAPGDAAAQTLRGSRGAVDRVYGKALAHDLTFYRNGRAVRSAASEGELVRLSGNANYRVASATYPYALPSTRLFVQRLGAQYRRACGEKLVVTSATRPRSVRLWNSVDKTVHPSGMAIDLRKSSRASCVRWLRSTLLALEGRGVIDATEERRPPHFHVAIFPVPYRRYVASDAGDGGSSTARRTARAGASRATGSTASRGTRAAASRSERTAGSSRTYRVRPGDSLWAIARRNGTTVARLRSLNGISGSRVKPGQVLRLPSSG